MNAQAEQLNTTLAHEAPIFWRLLSSRGRELFFPKGGIISQTAESRSAKLNATIGEGVADDGLPFCLSDIAKTVSLPPKNIFPYAPSAGLPELRTQWLSRMRAANPPIGNQPLSQPVVTCGVTHALSCASLLFIDPGDRIIVPDLRWENYDLMMETAFGGHLEPFQFFHGDHFNLDAFTSTLASQGKKCIVLLNFPNNPTGYTPTAKEMEAITSALKDTADQGKDVLVLCDDAYAGFIYEEDAYPYSPLASLASAHERIAIVKVDGASKEACAWGLRVGFVTFAAKNCSEEGIKALEQKAAGAVRATISCASRLSQELILHALKAPSLAQDAQRIRTSLQSRYKALIATMERAASPHYAMLPSNSGYFLCIRLAPTLSAEAVRQRMLKDHGCGLIALPGNLLRIAYSCVPERDIPALVQTIDAACTSFI